MNKGNFISPEVRNAIESAFNENKNWLAYNMEASTLEKKQVYLASSKGEAIGFAFENNSSSEIYRVIHFNSVNDAINNLITKNVSIMNEKNFEYLKENLKYAGFADKLNEQLEAEIKKQQPQFTLKLETEVNKQPVKAELYFKKSNETDMYFFNRYEIAMKNEKEGQPMTQTFYINHGHGVSLKEAYNLLNGRAVHKELENKAGEKYKAWIKLDFSEKDDKGNFKRQPFHENYGYNIEQALAKYPIKELLDEKQKADLIKSLQKGNVQVVTFEKDGESEKLFVEANPQFKSVNVYNIEMQRIQSKDLAERYVQGMNGKEQSTSENEKQDQKKNLKEKAGDELDNRKGKRQGRKKGISA